MGTLKRREWKTRECREKYRGWVEREDWKTPDKIARVENAGLANAGPNFSGVEKTGSPSMEREMNKTKCIPVM